MRVVSARLFKALFCSILVFSVSAPLRAAVVNAGNVTGVTITTNAINGNLTYSFALSGGGSSEITVYGPDVIRVNYHWAGPFDTATPMIAKPLNDWGSSSSTISDGGTKYVISTTLLDVEVEKTPYKVHFKSKNGFYLLQDDFTERDSDYGFTGQRGTGSSKLKNRKIFPANQAIMGLGEYGGPMNRRGREIDCWNTGTYNWGEFTNPTYMNIPFYYGLQPAAGGNPAFVYGVFLNNPCRPLFKFGTESGDRYSMQAGDGRMDYFFFGGGASHAFAKVTDRFSELTGRPTFLPKWGIGHHLSRFSYDSQSWVEYIANQATVSDIPLDAVYLDIDYMDADADGDFADGLLRQLTINSKFPTPSGMVSYCNTRGVKLIPLIEPWLQPGDPLHGEANSNLHFIKDNGGSTVTRNIYVGAVSWFDYSSTPMNTWWQGKIVNWFNTLAFAGIWNDLTEPEGGDQIPHNGLMWVDGQFGTSTTDSRRWWSNERNYFGLRCARQSYNAMLAKDSNKRPFVLSRSGNAGLQRFGVSWSGDTRANWFYHRATIRFGMGAMIAGAAWYGNDVGGFAGTVAADLMVRSTEANCLTPYFRNHCDKSAADREPWRFSEPYQSMQRDLIKFRYRLMPYFYTLAYESTITGEPMNAPPAFDYYADANTHAEASDYNFLVGDYLLAAPVYAEGASTRQVYLPYKEGVSWYYWHNNQQYNGGQTVNVNAPLGTLPLFVRSGAIIPMGPSMQYANQFQSAWMDINCWPDGQSEFTLFEDDGETWNYQGNGYSKRRMVSNRTTAYWDFTIEAKQGTYNTGARDFYVYCYNPGTNVVKSVRLNGTALPQLANFDDAAQGWRMTEGRIGIKVPDSSAEAAIRVTFADVEDSMQFEWPTYSLSETSSFVRVYVTRTGTATGALSVAYATANGTATAGSDYFATNGTLNWAIGDLAGKFVDVYLVDDLVYEGNENFSIQLSNANGGTLGSPSFTTVTIVENEAIPPALVVTNPVDGTVYGSAVSNITLQGMANALDWSGLVWSNGLTGASGTAPIAFYWSIGNVGIGMGTNLIAVTATNSGSALIAADSGTNAVYADGWATNDNGGFGWGPWVLYTSSSDINQNGRFMADNDSVNIGRPAWGLYANNGNLSEAKRLMTNVLTVGQVVSVSMDNGFLDNGAGTGVALQNTNGVTLWEFFFNGGDNYYSISGGTTDVGWTSGGIDVSFSLTSPTTYRALITPLGGTTRTNTGSLISAANSEIRVFRAWNFNAGSGSTKDYFFNNLRLTGSTGGSTSAVISVVRGSDSSIPQDWRDRYSLVGDNSGDGDDKDGDGLSNYDEYISDSNPTNPASFFGKVDTPESLSATGSVVSVVVQAPTTNSRRYDLLYTTNLIDGPWFPVGLSIPGADNGGSLILNATNGNNGIHYRARVFLP